MKCPGHKDECESCKRKEGLIRKLDGLTLIDNVTHKPTIDYCCKACKTNARYAEKFDPETNARFR